MIQSGKITNSAGEEINFNLFFEDNQKQKPLIIVSHGFKGYKEWGIVPYLCEAIANAGSIAVAFDFSLNGVVNPDIPEYDNEKFSRNTLSREVLDLKELIDYFKVNPPKNWNGKLVLVGHSLGGAVSLMNAHRHHQVDKLILIASISRLHRNTDRQLAAWKKKGFSPVRIRTTGQELQLSYSYAEDKNNFAKDELPKAISEIDSKVLIIHPENDLTVRIEEAEELWNALNNKQSSQYVVIPKSGHTFGVIDKVIKENDALKLLKEKIIKFIFDD